MRCHGSYGYGLKLTHALSASFNELNYPAVHWNGGTPWAIEYTVGLLYLIRG